MNKLHERRPWQHWRKLWYVDDKLKSKELFDRDHILFMSVLITTHIFSVFWLYPFTKLCNYSYNLNLKIIKPEVASAFHVDSTDTI